jgi:hypothetical protein
MRFAELPGNGGRDVTWNERIYVLLVVFFSVALSVGIAGGVALAGWCLYQRIPFPTEWVAGLALAAGVIGGGFTIGFAFSRDMQDGTAWSQIKGSLPGGIVRPAEAWANIKRDFFQMLALVPMICIGIVLSIVAALVWSFAVKAASPVTERIFASFGIGALAIIFGGDFILFRGLDAEVKFRKQVQFATRAIFAAALIVSCAYVVGVMAGGDYLFWLTLGWLPLAVAWVLATAAIGIGQATASGQSWWQTRGARAARAGLLGWLVTIGALVAIYAYLSHGNWQALLTHFGDKQTLDVFHDARIAVAAMFMIGGAPVGAIATLAGYLWPRRRRRFSWAGLWRGTLDATDEFALTVSRARLFARGLVMIVLGVVFWRLGSLWWTVVGALTHDFANLLALVEIITYVIYGSAVLGIARGLGDWLQALRYPAAIQSGGKLGTAKTAGIDTARAVAKGDVAKPPWAGHGYQD